MENGYPPMVRRLAAIGILCALAGVAEQLPAAEAIPVRTQAPVPQPAGNADPTHWAAWRETPQPVNPPVVRPAAAEPLPAEEVPTAPADLPAGLLPQERSPLTLSDLQQIALECNPTLVQARMAVSAAEGGLVQAGLYPNPSLAYVADEIGNDGSSGLQGMGISQEIVTRGKLRLGQAVASCEVQQAEQAWEAQRLRVMNDVRIGFYEALLAQKRIEINEQLLGIEQQILSSTQQLRAAAEVSEVDVLQARIETEKAALNLKEARDRQLGCWRRLAALIGKPELELVSLAGDVTRDLPVITWEDAFSRLLTQSPELAQAYAGLERARCELARQCAQRFPNVDVGTAVKYDTGSRFAVVDVEVGMPLPIFDRNQGNIVRAQSALAAAERELQRVELDLRERLATAYWQYCNARRRAEAYAQTILPHARKSLDLTRVGYREGEFAYLALLTAQRTFHDTMLNYLSSLEDLWARSVELEGMLLRGGLQAPAGVP